MSVLYVPHQPPPSARAQALGGILAETIHEFRRTQGDISGLEIQQALHLAFTKSVAGRAKPPALVAVALVAAAMAGGVLPFLLNKKGISGDAATAIPIVIGVVVMILVVLFVVRLRQG